jgi:hypothetical protein
LRGTLSNVFPRTTPRSEEVIPAGHSGWMRIYAADEVGILGAMINYNAGAGTGSGAFNQGHNLHQLTLTDRMRLTIPVFPPGCQ